MTNTISCETTLENFVIFFSNCETILKFVFQKQASSKYERICSPKCSANSIAVTPIWKWEFANGAASHHAMVYYNLTTKEVKFHLNAKDYKWCRDWMFTNSAIRTENGESYSGVRLKCYAGT